MINDLTKGLVIKSPWIEMILHRQKTWEIRGSNTHIRGRIGLIKSGSGLILGSVNLINSLPMNLNDWHYFWPKHRVFTDDLPYKNTYAWVLENPIVFKEPIPYKHPMGAVIWVNL